MADTPKPLVWDESGKRFFEAGVDRGVLYPRDKSGTYPKGVAWNGLTKVSESPSGGETTTLWADNAKYLNLVSTEEFGCTIECYTYPDEFAVCNGETTIADGVTIGQQNRQMFGFSYRTKLGNDVDGNDHGYKIHLVYGCYAKPSSKEYATVDDSPDAVTLSYEISTTPVNVAGMQPTATVVIDSTKTPKEKMTAIEEILYGKEGTAARLPLPAEIITTIGTTQPSGQDTQADKANVRPTVA